MRVAPARADGPWIGHKRVKRQHRLRNALDCAGRGGAACVAQGALGEHHAAGEKLWRCMSCALFPATVQRCEGLHAARRLVSLSWGMHPTVKCALSPTACHSGAGCFALMSWSPATRLGLEWLTRCKRQAIVQLVVMVTTSCKSHFKKGGGVLPAACINCFRQGCSAGRRVTWPSSRTRPGTRACWARARSGRRGHSPGCGADHGSTCVLVR